MKLPLIAFLLAVPAFVYLTNATENYKDFMEGDDFKKNELADFDLFDEDDEFEMDSKVEEESKESQKWPVDQTFTVDDATVEVTVVCRNSPICTFPR